MGNGLSRWANSEMTPDEIVEAGIIQKSIDREGPSGIVKYVRGKIDSLQTEAIDIGVVGRYRTGRSTFINAVLSLGPGKTDAAKSGSGGLTHYEQPTSSRLVLRDFPGVGSLEFPKDRYLSHIITPRCDCFLIFVKSVINEDDLWLAENFRILKKPFCFVRSMIDQDIANAEYDRKDVSEVLEDIREKATTTISQHPIIAGSNIFFISARHTHIGEFHLLLKHMEEKFPSLKFDAMVGSMSTIIREVTDRKNKKLKSRIRIGSIAASALSAVCIPALDIPINSAYIIYEIKHCFEAFGFSSENVANLTEDVKNRLTLRPFSLRACGMSLSIFSIVQIGKLAALKLIQNSSVTILPGYRSLLSASITFITLYWLLNNKLENMRKNAFTVYNYILETLSRTA